ncbi:M23 family metallopeptidase [Chryseobacterium sp.]|uniref:M23 family metallopeptidase n=1 Tax=Chryseobacterium sp. TaxID=1871047 RepID=UPI001629E88A|nr:M23 family metallopeptidase [Chryseobacterium sp.]
MKSYLKNKKNINLILGGLLAVVFIQGLLLAKLFSEKNDKSYEVNLVQINTQKDSVDYQKIKTDLSLVDNTVRELNSFLASKNITDGKIAILAQDSISNSVYLAKQSNRYSQYLVDVQNKLQQVPLGLPTDGYISSNFGTRKNPIPVKRVMLASVKSIVPGLAVAAEPVTEVVQIKDSLGKVIKEVKVVKSTNAATVSSKSVVQAADNAPAEPDQMQFHKGLDIAVPYGSDVRCAASGTVIFAGTKGGYGNCVIVSHGNGLATLYGHLSELLVETNDVIKVNQVIARSGNSGRSTGPHLHYEVHKNNRPVNPKLFMNL